MLFIEAEEGYKIAEEFWVWVIHEKEIIKIMDELSMENVLKNPMKTFCKEIEYERRRAQAKG